MNNHSNSEKTQKSPPSLFKIRKKRNSIFPSIALIFLTFLIGTVIYACSPKYRYSYRFKMIVEIDTPEGIVSGSNVIQVRVAGPIRSMTVIDSRRNRITAEALPIQLAGKTLFVSLWGGRRKYRNGTSVDYINYVMEIAFSSYDKIFIDDYYQVNPDKTSFVLSENNYPAFFVFSDFTDPATNRLVFADEFETIFGAGYQLKTIAVQLTDEPVVSHKIEKILPWITIYDGRGKPDDEVIVSNPTIESFPITCKNLVYAFIRKDKTVWQLLQN